MTSKYVRTTVYVTLTQHDFIKDSEYSLSGLVRKTIQNIIDEKETSI